MVVRTKVNIVGATESVFGNAIACIQFVSVLILRLAIRFLSVNIPKIATSPAEVPAIAMLDLVFELGHELLRARSRV